MRSSGDVFVSEKTSHQTRGVFRGVLKIKILYFFENSYGHDSKIYPKKVMTKRYPKKLDQKTPKKFPEYPPVSNIFIQFIYKKAAYLLNIKLLTILHLL